MPGVLSEKQQPTIGFGIVGRFEEVLSALGHDLRSPLGAAHLNIETALGRLSATSEIASEIRVPLQRASEIMKQTVALIEDLLREARQLDTRTLAAEPSSPGGDGGQAQLFDLRDMIHDCVALQATALQTARCTLNVYCEASILGSWSRAAIHQILSNLILNATKYAPGEPIEVHASRADDAVTIVVADRGPGFSIEEQERVFERFRREPRAGAPEGFGLGLWIVRRAVDRLGGTVRLISSPGEGSMFLIEIPCDR